MSSSRTGGGLGGVTTENDDDDVVSLGRKDEMAVPISSTMVYNVVRA